MDFELVHKSPLPPLPFAVEASITLVYQEEPIRRYVECPVAAVSAASRYLDGLLKDRVASEVFINVIYPEYFATFLQPYLLGTSEPHVPTACILNVVQDASLLGMDKLVYALYERMGEHLAEVMTHPLFRVCHIQRDAMTQILLTHWLRCDYPLSGDIEKKNASLGLRLLAMLHWLKDSDFEECDAMRKFFAEKLKCSWVDCLQTLTREDIESRFCNLELGDTYRKFFSSEWGNLGEQTAKDYCVCKLCENQIPKVHCTKQTCLGSTREPFKHSGMWRNKGESKTRDRGHWTCCYSRDKGSTRCQVTVQLHKF